MSANDVVPAAGTVSIAPGEAEAGRRAGEVAAQVLREALRERSQARIVFANAPSQDAMIRTLTSSPDLDWIKVTSMRLGE